MAHYVTCIYCKQKFDRDKKDAVQVSPRRYAHKECFDKQEEQKTQEEKDLSQLEEYIKQLLKENFINPKVRKQIKEYHEKYNYSYSGIYRTLVWFYEIKGNSLDKANGGIGIVPYVYKDAYDYYYKIFLAQNLNKEKTLNLFKPHIKEIWIKPPTTYVRPPKLFNLNLIKDKEDE